MQRAVAKQNQGVPQFLTLLLDVLAGAILGHLAQVPQNEAVKTEL